MNANVVMGGFMGLFFCACIGLVIYYLVKDDKCKKEGKKFNLFSNSCESSSGTSSTDNKKDKKDEEEEEEEEDEDDDEEEPTSGASTGGATGGATGGTVSYPATPGAFSDSQIASMQSIYDDDGILQFCAYEGANRTGNYNLIKINSNNEYDKPIKELIQGNLKENTWGKTFTSLFWSGDTTLPKCPIMIDGVILNQGDYISAQNPEGEYYKGDADFTGGFIIGTTPSPDETSAIKIDSYSDSSGTIRINQIEYKLEKKSNGLFNVLNPDDPTDVWAYDLTLKKISKNHFSAIDLTHPRCVYEQSNFSGDYKWATSELTDTQKGTYKYAYPGEEDSTINECIYPLPDGNLATGGTYQIRFAEAGYLKYEGGDANKNGAETEEETKMKIITEKDSISISYNGDYVNGDFSSFTSTKTSFKLERTDTVGNFLLGSGNTPVTITPATKAQVVSDVTIYPAKNFGQSGNATTLEQSESIRSLSSDTFDHEYISMKIPNRKTLCLYNSDITDMRAFTEETASISTTGQEFNRMTKYQVISGTDKNQCVPIYFAPNDKKFDRSEGAPATDQYTINGIFSKHNDGTIQRVSRVPDVNYYFSAEDATLSPEFKEIGYDSNSDDDESGQLMVRMPQGKSVLYTELVDEEEPDGDTKEYCLYNREEVGGGGGWAHWNHQFSGREGKNDNADDAYYKGGFEASLAPIPLNRKKLKKFTIFENEEECGGRGELKSA